MRISTNSAQITADTLPDPLVSRDRIKVENALTWRSKRRAELLHLFEKFVYGRGPHRPNHEWFELIRSDFQAMNGKVTLKEIAIHFTRGNAGPQMRLVVLVPNQSTKPAAIFLGTEDWHWPKELMLQRGYAIAYLENIREDIEQDENPEGWKKGIRGFFLKQTRHMRFAPHDWGAIGAWAWALSRALDYLVTDSDVDARRVAVMGHSRWGKAALWAGAQDERFAMVISNESGSGGAALARSSFGQAQQQRDIGIRDTDGSHSHWFCEIYKQYVNRVDDLPVDQHELLALIAPRPVYIASAEEDQYTNPLSEFLAAKYADSVYRLFGLVGLGVKEMPPVNTPVGNFIGYHCRTGKHGVTDYDWKQYLRFADCHFGIKPKPCFSTPSLN
ncbi:MAG TPA: hypothetical protein VIX17_01975 [Pyrinomonadaceae bacterium]|jgi:hypothetical protein